MNTRDCNVMTIRTLPVKELLKLGFDVMVAALFVAIIGGGSVFLGIGFTSEGDEALGGIFLAIGIVTLLAGMIGVQIKLIADSVSAAIYLNTDLINTGRNVIPTSVKLVSRTDDPNSNQNNYRACTNCGASNIIANTVCKSCSLKLVNPSQVTPPPRW